MAADLQQIAREVLEAHDRGAVMESISGRHAGFDWSAAYEVAAEIVKLRRARGERTVGRKIGFTNRNIWPEYGATSPIWAHIYDRTLVYAASNRASVSLQRSTSPRIEPEIAFKLSRAPAVGSSDLIEILESIEWFAPAFEIVDCHFADWKFESADSAADLSFHWRLIVGTPVQAQSFEIGDLAQRLRDCSVALRCGGELRAQGVGSNALDHPAFALAFLADIVAKQPAFDALAPGEVITTGTLTAALPIRAGETWTSEITGLGVEPLTVSFSA